MTQMPEFVGRGGQNRGHIKPERRKHRRHLLEGQGITVGKADSRAKIHSVVGQLIDLSAGGARIRTAMPNIRPDQQIRLKIQLPTYAGICPFIDTTEGSVKPKTEWVGWMAVSRVQQLDDGRLDVGGRLIDMDELDRGMLGLYLSTQPLAA